LLASALLISRPQKNSMISRSSPSEPPELETRNGPSGLTPSLTQPEFTSEETLLLSYPDA
jgi:hypothetical protein